ncbi:MAG TPA: BREX-1 system phosphatase PglZ type A [Paludibacter sp.]
MTLQEKIVNYFNYHSNAHILFFFDPDGDRIDELKSINITDIRVVEFAGDWFNMKVKFNKDWKQDKVFLYLTQSMPQTQDELKEFPLLDLLKANGVLRLDDVGAFMEEFRLQPHQHQLAKDYLDELQKSLIQSVLQPLLNAASFEKKALQKGLISAFLEFSKIEDWDLLIIRLLSWSIDSKQKSLKRFLDKVIKYQLLDELNSRLRLVLDVEISGKKLEEITNLVRKFKYNSIIQNLVVSPADPYKELRVRDSSCFESLNRIRETGLNHLTLAKTFAEALRVNGESIQERKLLELYGPDADFVFMPETLKWEIISNLLTNTDRLPDETEKILQRLFVQTQMEGVIKDTLLFLRYSTALLSNINSAGNVVLDSPKEYLQQYSTKYFQVDRYYRKSIEQYQQLEWSMIPIEEQLEALKSRIENGYARFTYQLNHEWLECMKATDFEYSSIDCFKQYDFFNNWILPQKKKVAVIISDALRYEVAHDLINELHKDDKNVSSLTYQLSSLPSITSIGMANLLPGRTLTYDGSITIDNEKPIGIDQRDKILKKQSEKYTAVSFDTIQKSTKQDNRELFKADVVYVYHDIIDKEGHKGTERNTFIASKNAIQELAKMVKLIQGGFNVTKVFITADHGYLYNDSDIEEADKNEMEDTDILESGARHYMTKSDLPVTLGSKIPLNKVSRFKEPWFVVIPDSVNRFKKAGSRYRFTHGGGSLQEMVVPLIESTRKEEKIQRKVKPLLLNHNLTIVSNNLRFQLIQENPISASEKECTLDIGIYNESTLVSNTMTVTMNRTGELPADRVFLIPLALNTKTSSSVLRLKIFDKEDMLNPLIEESVKNNTLVERDF